MKTLQTLTILICIFAFNSFTAEFVLKAGAKIQGDLLHIDSTNLFLKGQDGRIYGLPIASLSAKSTLLIEKFKKEGTKRPWVVDLNWIEKDKEYQAAAAKADAMNKEYLIRDKMRTAQLNSGKKWTAQQEEEFKKFALSVSAAVERKRVCEAELKQIELKYQLTDLKKNSPN